MSSTNSESQRESRVATRLVEEDILEERLINVMGKKSEGFLHIALEPAVNAAYPPIGSIS